MARCLAYIGWLTASLVFGSEHCGGIQEQFGRYPGQEDEQQGRTRPSWLSSESAQPGSLSYCLSTALLCLFFLAFNWSCYYSMYLERSDTDIPEVQLICLNGA